MKKNRIFLASVLLVAAAFLSACGGSDGVTTDNGPTERLKVVVTSIDCAYAAQNLIAGQTGAQLSCGYITASGDVTVESVSVKKTGTADDDSVTNVGMGLFSEKGGSGFYASEAVSWKNGQLTLRPNMKIASGGAVPFQVLGDVAYRYNGIAVGTTVGFELGGTKVVYDTTKFAGVDISFINVSGTQLRPIADGKSLLITQELFGHQFESQTSGFIFMRTRVTNLDPVPSQLNLSSINLGSSQGFDAGWFMVNCTSNLKLKVMYEDGSFSMTSADQVGWLINFNTAFFVPPLSSVTVELTGDTLGCYIGGSSYVDFYMQGQQFWYTLKRPSGWAWGQPAHMLVPAYGGKG